MKFIGRIEGSEGSLGVANPRWEGKIVDCKGKRRCDVLICLVLRQGLYRSLFLFNAEVLLPSLRHHNLFACFFLVFRFDVLDSPVLLL